MGISEAVEYPWHGSKPKSAEGFVCLPPEVRARLERRTLASIPPGDVAFVNFESVVLDTQVEGAMMVDARDTLPNRAAFDKFDPRYNPAVMRIFNEDVDGYIVDYRRVIEMKKTSRLTDGTADSVEYKDARSNHGAEPALGFVALDSDGEVVMQFVDGYDFTEDAVHMMKKVDEMIPEIAAEKRAAVVAQGGHELVIAAENLLRFTKRVLPVPIKNILSFLGSR